MISLVNLDNSKRLLALRKLGFDVDDDGYVYDKSTKKELMCIYSKEKVHISTAAILPGSVKIINATPLTMAQYFMDIDI